jgi:hypothetical protein
MTELFAYLVFMQVWTVVMLGTAITGNYRGMPTIAIAAVAAFIPYALIIWLA